MVDPSVFVQNTLNTIWNKKMVGLIYETFATRIRVHRSCHDDLYGQEALIVDIVERLAAFPDLLMTIEDIIWQGDEHDCWVSIRLRFSGHNLGVSRYGDVTQQEITHRVLLNAWIINQCFEEVWIAEDERTLVEQLGYGLLDAMRSIEMQNAFIGQSVSESITPAMGEIQRQNTSLISVENLSKLQLYDQQALREILTTLWNGRQVGICEQFYSDDFICHWASDRHLTGREEYQAIVLAQLAAFPDLYFYIDDVIEQKRGQDWHVAVSWTLLGTHSGPSIYGKPSGKRVKITGISQYVIRDEQFISEHTEWNEFRLMQQIVEHQTTDSNNQHPLTDVGTET